MNLQLSIDTYQAAPLDFLKLIKELQSKRREDVIFYSASHLVFLALSELHNGAYWEFL